MILKENICTIPINDIFKETYGCPICRMYDSLEAQYVEYITGAAMMAPDVRIITNKTGFCHKHFEMMVNTGPKLSNALLMQTHLDEIRNNLLPKSESSAPSKKQIQEIKELDKTCYVCDRIEKDILHLLATVFVQFAKDEEFRQLYQNQEYICLNHYELLMTQSQLKPGVDKRFRNLFFTMTNTLTRKYIDQLYNDVTHLTTMYDYRNRGGDWKNSKDSVERSIKFLTGKNITVK